MGLGKLPILWKPACVFPIDNTSNPPIFCEDIPRVQVTMSENDNVSDILRFGSTSANFFPERMR